MAFPQRSEAESINTEVLRLKPVIEKRDEDAGRCSNKLWLPG